MNTVTVVVPTRNRRTLLTQALRSIVRQRAVDLQVVVIDDGSDEDMALVCREIGDTRVRVIRQETPHGVSAARNLGLANATTEWIAFCDDDDLWSPEKLARQIATAREAGCDWAYAGCVHVNAALMVQNGTPPLPGDQMCRALRRYNAMPAGASNVLVRADLLKRLGGFDESLTHLPDWDLWIRLAAHGAPAAVASPLVGYRIHGGNASFRTDEMLAEVSHLERRHQMRADRSRFHRHLAHLCLRSGRRREALVHFARAYIRVQDGYALIDVTTDLRLIYEHAADVVRRRTLGRRPPAAPNRGRDPHASWKAQAQAWLDECRG